MVHRVTKSKTWLNLAPKHSGIKQLNTHANWDFLIHTCSFLGAATLSHTHTLHIQQVYFNFSANMGAYWLCKLRVLLLFTTLNFSGSLYSQTEETENKQLSVKTQYHLGCAEIICECSFHYRTPKAKLLFPIKGTERSEQVVLKIANEVTVVSILLPVCPVD